MVVVPTTLPVPAELIRRLGIVEATYVWATLRGEKPQPAVPASSNRATGR